MATATKRTKIYLFVVVLIITSCMLSSCNFLNVALWLLIDDEDPFYTEDIAHYTDPESNIRLDFYLGEVPDDATVVFFSHYNNYDSNPWNLASDMYLEIKFNNEEDMQNYLDNVKSHIIKSSKSTEKSEEKLFIQEQNPYDASFVDLIDKRFCWYSEEKCYTGYKVKENSESNFFIVCHFGVISYSFESLTVVQSLLGGSFASYDSDYIPKYFGRFNVSLEEGTKRVYVI